MHVEIHKLFEEFQAALARQPSASIVESLTEPPQLKEFLGALDPSMKLDWSGQSFQGMPGLREKILRRMDITERCSIDSTTSLSQPVRRKPIFWRLPSWCSRGTRLS
jgi:hypothetical protein